MLPLGCAVASWLAAFLVGAITCPGKGHTRYCASPAEDDFVGFDGGDKAVDYVADIAPPILSTVHLQAAFPDVVFEHAFLVREMTEFHWFDLSIHDEG